MPKTLFTTENRMNVRRFMRRSKYKYMAVNRLVPHLPWMVLFLLATYLYKERIFADSGFYVSQFINNKFFWIECQRIVLAFSQVIPLVAVWLGLQMKYVLLLYSLSHILFFYFLFLFTYYGLRDRHSGLLILLAQVVGIVHSFYTPMFELYYGVPLLITFYAIWRLNYKSSGILIWLLLLEVLILTSHPLAFMLFLFLLLYDFKRSNAKPLKYYLLIALVYVSVIVFKMFIMCDYEVGKFGWQFNYQENKQYLQLINPLYYKTLALFMVQYYWDVLIALVLVIILLISKKEYWRLFVVLGTFGVYLFLVNTAYTVSPSRYMEQVMFPFVPIVFIPLIYGFPIGNRQGLQNIAVFSVGALIVFRLLVLYQGSEIFVLRVQQMEQLIETARQKGGSKFIVSESQSNHGYSQVNWSYPIETMLLSAIDGSDIAVTIVPEEDFNFEGNKDKLKADEFIFRKWELKNYSWINKQYFHFDIGPYRKLNDTVLNSPNEDALHLIDVKSKASNYYRANDTVWIPVEIRNAGTSTLYSGGSNKVFISYFWIKNGLILDWSGIRTPLQSDIVSNGSQHIRVAIPKEKGKFEFQVDMLFNDNWLGMKNEQNVFVY